MLTTRIVVVLGFVFAFCTCSAQLSEADFYYIDSLIESTQSIDLCKKDGKEDLRFFTKTPEKYSDFKSVFFKQTSEAIRFSEGSKFRCGIEAEIDCSGRAGNFSFSIEPKIFNKEDFENFKELIALINRIRDFRYQPASYLGEFVNSKARLKLVAVKGQLQLQ